MSTTFAQDGRPTMQAGEGSDILFVRNVTLSVPKAATPGLRQRRSRTRLERRATPWASNACTDTELESRCREALRWATTLPEQAVEVSVKDGHVTLRGCLDQTAQVQAVEEVLRGVQGVSGIENQIRVA